MSKFGKIAIVRKDGDDDRINPIMHTIVGWCNQHNVELLEEIPKVPTSDMLIVSLGGDGTMLSALRKSLDHPGATVIGFNAGTLGFLSEDFSIEKFVAFLGHVHRGTDQVITEERTVLEGHWMRVLKVGRNTKSIKAKFAINEFVLAPETLRGVATFNVFINDKPAATHKASGMIVSTATGSTAMALSSGGAIIHPSTKVMQIIPIAPHTLTSRPIITTGRDIIEIRTEVTSRIPTLIGLGDGQTLFVAEWEEGLKEIRLTISKSEKVATIWRPTDWNFFEVLSNKMKWR